ncbi:UNVERIFIED_ORG: hypothetical protein ABIB19_002811 [Arthrobacter sp. UYEF10]
MILREISFDRFMFTCTGCDHAWGADYDVQHVEDGHGHERDYFFRNGLHCTDPTGLGETTCPHCGRTAVIAHHSARQPGPPATDEAPEVPVETPAPAPELPADIPAPARSIDWDTAPLLSGTR